MVVVRLELLEVLRVGLVTGVRVPTEPAEPALMLREALVLPVDVVPVLREALLSLVTVRLALELPVPLVLLVLLGRLYVDVDCVERVACVACVEVERLLEPVLETERPDVPVDVEVVAERLEVAGATLLTCCEPEDVTERLPVDCDTLLEEVVADALLEAVLVTLLVEADDSPVFAAKFLAPFRDELLRDATDRPERPLSHPRPVGLPGLKFSTRAATLLSRPPPGP